MSRKGEKRTGFAYPRFTPAEGGERKERDVRLITSPRRQGYSRVSSQILCANRLKKGKERGGGGEGNPVRLHLLFLYRERKGVFSFSVPKKKKEGGGENPTIAACLFCRSCLRGEAGCFTIASSTSSAWYGRKKGEEKKKERRLQFHHTFARRGKMAGSCPARPPTEGKKGEREPPPSSYPTSRPGGEKCANSTLPRFQKGKKKGKKGVPNHDVVPNTLFCRE